MTFYHLFEVDRSTGLIRAGSSSGVTPLHLGIKAEESCSVAYSIQMQRAKRCLSLSSQGFPSSAALALAQPTPRAASFFETGGEDAAETGMAYRYTDIGTPLHNPFVIRM